VVVVVTAGSLPPHGVANTIVAILQFLRGPMTTVCPLIDFCM